MTRLKIQTRKVIDSFNWDIVIKSVYGKHYCLQQQAGCRDRGAIHLTVPEDTYDYENREIPDNINGTEMGINFKDWLARDNEQWNGDPEDKRFLNMFWERNFYPDVQMVANDLHLKGILPSGEYYIEIDW